MKATQKNMSVARVRAPTDRRQNPRPALPILLLLVLAACSAPRPPETAAVSEAEARPAIDLENATVPFLQTELAAGRLGAETLSRAYLQRIAAIDDAGPRLNAVIEINPDALDQARALDRSFAAEGVVGPLHGIPVLLKANIDTGDKMATSAGSLALAQHRAAKDAFHVQRLRAAGAVILGKTNLSEWANFRDRDSSSGWSSLGGQTRNPHVLDRNPCGSSSGSGVAVAAALAPLAVGTETNGSIVCPAGANGIVGIKPTLGTVSRSGIIPIAHSQDTAGPMAKTVTGAAIMLEAMIGADPADPGTRAWPGGAPLLRPDPEQLRLDGVRIGVYRSYYGAGDRPKVEAVYAAAIEQLEALGATLVDPIEYEAPEGSGAAQFAVLLHEFKHDLNQYLAAQPDLPDDRNSLEKLIAWNTANAAAVLPIFGQDLFDLAQASGTLEDEAYLQARETANVRLLETVNGWLDAQTLDALLVPVNGPAWKTDWLEGDRYSFGGTSTLAAVSGLPQVVIPAGDVMGLPVNVGFIGAAFSEAQLIQYAYALEQALDARLTPAFRPSLEAEAN